MTAAEPDDVLTAADLLFGSSEGAHEALARHVMSAGRTMARAFERLPRVTREAAVREAALAAVGLLKVDLMEVLVAGWREHRDVFSAARRTLDMPGSRELVGLAPHRITTVQQPAVSILVDGRRVHTLQLGLSIFFEVTGLVAGIHAGRLAGIHAGRGEVGVALTIHELEALTKRSHLELPGVKSLKRGFRLLPASHYPDDSHGHPGGQHLGGQLGGHPGGQLPGGELPAAVPAAAHFPGVDLMDGHVPATDLNAARPAQPDLNAASPAQPDLNAASPAQPDLNAAGPAQPGIEHPASAETEHASTPWWERSQPQPGPLRRGRHPRRIRQNGHQSLRCRPYQPSSVDVVSSGRHAAYLGDRRPTPAPVPASGVPALLAHCRDWWYAPAPVYKAWMSQSCGRENTQP